MIKPSTTNKIYEITMTFTLTEEECGIIANLPLKTVVHYFRSLIGSHAPLRSIMEIRQHFKKGE